MRRGEVAKRQRTSSVTLASDTEPQMGEFGQAGRPWGLARERRRRRRQRRRFRAISRSFAASARSRSVSARARGGGSPGRSGMLRFWRADGGNAKPAIRSAAELRRRIAAIPSFGVALVRLVAYRLPSPSDSRASDGDGA